MAKNKPIASKNRTHLFIKKILKLGRFRHFRLRLKSNLPRQALKKLVKKFGWLYLWLNPRLAKDQLVTKPVKLGKKTRLHLRLAKKRVKKRRLKPTPLLGSTALQGWSWRDFAPLWPQPLVVKPLLPKVKPPKKIGRIKQLSWRLVGQPWWRRAMRGFRYAPPRKITTRWLALVLFITGFASGIYLYLFRDLPTPMQLTKQEQRVTTRILSRQGEVLFRIYEDENRTLIKLNDVPQYMIDATLAIEDQDFYYHHGFSLSGIIRAGVANWRGQTIEQGGSTITQQLVKNRLLTPERTIRRKLRELIIAVMVEWHYSKDEILEMYLNQVAYGGTIYGVEEAAQHYFGKEVSQLSLAESSLLAGLPQAPSIYSPFGASPELAQQRQREVLRRMVGEGYITQQAANSAAAQELNYRQDVIDIQAPHFVMYVKKLLAEQYGEMTVNQGGLEVTTTLDLPLHQAAQKIVTQEVETLAKLRVYNGAALVTHPQTGEVLSMVGSKDYFDFAHDGQVNVTLRPRQPGSSIKPLTYSLALTQGKTPSSIIDDSPITYHTSGSKPYSPRNYDGKFHGRVSLREALASSYNVPAVKTLAEVGVSNMIDQAEKMGIDTWQDRSRFGLSLTLGGGEVTMVDLAEMYSTFANYGHSVDLNPILEVKNYKGEILYRNTCVLENKGCPKTQALETQVAYQVTHILADNQARTPAFGPRSVLYIPNQEVAVKTGTTNNLRDNWTIGYTTDRLVAVWVGNNDNTPMSYVASGITGASPIWNQIMRLLLNQSQPHRFLPAEGLVKVSICAESGTLPCDSCPTIKEEWFVPGTDPPQACNPSWFEKKDEDSGEEIQAEKREERSGQIH